MTPPNRHARRHAPSEHDGPVYWECATCGFLSHDPGFADVATHCSACGSGVGPRRIFPAERLRRVDERIRRYDADGESEVVVILVATFLESLMEDMLARIMAAEGASVQLRAAVLDTMRSVGQRIGKLFEAELKENPHIRIVYGVTKMGAHIVSPGIIRPTGEGI